jgi:hypothetical protein
MRAARHPEPAVRAEAIRLALGYDDAQLDAMALTRVTDGHRAVRLAAVELAVRRRSPAAFTALDDAMNQEEFLSRDAEELRAWCAALASFGSIRAVPALSRLLAPTLLGRIMPSVDANLAAIEALGAIDHDHARAQLEKALRSLNKTVRAAARRALDQSALLKLRDVPTPVEEPSASSVALVPMRSPTEPQPENFEHEVRGVIASLFDDEGPGGGHR